MTVDIRHQTEDKRQGRVLSPDDLWFEPSLSLRHFGHELGEKDREGGCITEAYKLTCS
jgi:hypothetical protein